MGKMMNPLESFGIGGWEAALSLVIIYLFHRVSKNHAECQEDRTELRRKLEKQDDKITELVRDLTEAKVRAKAPCDKADCPKREYFSMNDSG